MKNDLGIMLFLVLGLFLVGCAPEKAIFQVPKMWGNLNQGPYQVGFKTLFYHDETRASIPYSDWEGRLYPTPKTKGRQMQINVWYPAQPKANHKPVKFDHYLNLFAQQTDYSTLDSSKISFANQQFINMTNALGGNGEFDQAKLEVLRQLDTHAFDGAPALDEFFPLVIFPNGGSPAFQSIMCEFLTSHGFVVAAVATKGRDSYTNEASTKGIEVAVIDLDFSVRKLLSLPQVDPEKIAMIGNAISSSQIVAYQCRNATLKVIVSLEGGLLSAFEQNLLKKTPFYQPASVDVPILAIYAPHPAIDPSHIFHLKHSERYFFHFPNMSEFHFLNYGSFESFVPEIIGPTKAEVQKGFELGNQMILHFLNYYLKGDQKAMEFLRTVPENTIDTFFVRKALPKPPALALVKHGFSNDGFQYIDSVYKHYKLLDPTPFPIGFYKDLKDWLAWKKDPDFEYRYRLFSLALDSYPQSAEVNYYLGYFALKTGRNVEAVRYNEKALELLAMNSDPELTVSRKSLMENYIRGDLEQLKVLVK